MHFALKLIISQLVRLLDEVVVGLQNYISLETEISVCRTQGVSFCLLVFPSFPHGLSYNNGITWHAKYVQHKKRPSVSSGCAQKMASCLSHINLTLQAAGEDI